METGKSVVATLDERSQNIKKKKQVCYLFAEVGLADELGDEVKTDVHGRDARYGGWQQGTRVAL